MIWRRKRKKSTAATRTLAQDLAAAVAAAPPPLPRGVGVLLGVAAGVVLAFGLYAIRGIVAPVVLALVLTICVHPLRGWLERRGVPRGLATGSVVATVFLLLATFIAALLLSLAQFATLLPTFAPQIQAIGVQFADWLGGFGIGAAQADVIVEGFDPTQAVDFVAGLFGGLASLTGALVVVLTSLILMASDAGYLGTLFAQLRPTRQLMVDELRVFAYSVRRYMVVTTVLGVVQGTLNAVALLIIGVPGAFLWGLLAFLGSFIPNVGYFIAIIPPLIFAFLTGGWEMVIPVLLVYTLINGVVQSVVQPRVVGNAVRLTQTITFVSVLVWAAIIGPVGAILAIPLTLLVRMVLVDMDPTARWWRSILGDLDETKTLMKDEDAVRKATRTERKAARGAPKVDRAEPVE